MSIWKEKVILGMSPELVDQVKYKVKKLKQERDELKKEYYDLMKRVGLVEGKIEGLKSALDSFKQDIINSIMENSKQEISKEISSQVGELKENEALIKKINEEISKLTKSQSDIEFNYSFQDYFQLIKLCIFLITNANEKDVQLIESVIKTITALITDMHKNGFFKPAKNAIMISLSNLKNYWDSRNEQIGMLIASQIERIKKEVS